MFGQGGGGWRGRSGDAGTYTVPTIHLTGADTVFSEGSRKLNMNELQNMCSKPDQQTHRPPERRLVNATLMIRKVKNV